MLQTLVKGMYKVCVKPLGRILKGKREEDCFGEEIKNLKNWDGGEYQVVGTPMLKDLPGIL